MNTIETAKRIITYWEKEKYSNMYRFCQKSWKWEKSYTAFKIKMKEYVVRDMVIDKVIMKNSLMGVVISSGIINGNPGKLLFNMVKESAPYKANENGEWGINPTSLTILQ